MTIAHAVGLAFVRLASPDLDAAEAFLSDFGLERAHRTPTRLFMRGTDAAPYTHITEVGAPRYIGAAFAVAREEDLVALASLPGASSVEESPEPGGGKRVKLVDPDGHSIEAVHGLASGEARSVEIAPLNNGRDRLLRAGAPYRRPPGPARVKRLGHFVIGSPDVQRSILWYRETFGLVQSDDVWAGSKDHLIASFNRISRGLEYVDHHVMMVHEAQEAALNHFGFEVQDLDDVHFGHQHLKNTARYDHRWGVGRHVLGSQVFNQWLDPWGRAHEHWADTDMLNANNPGALVGTDQAFRSQWGDPPPVHLMNSPSLGK